MKGALQIALIKNTKLKREEKDRRGEENYLYIQAIFYNNTTINNT